MELGQVINKYKIVEVYREQEHSTTGSCVNLELKTKWFIKFIPNAFIDSSEEMSNLLLLDHGSVPKVIDVIYTAEGNYLVLEFIKGMMLHDYLSQHKLGFKAYIAVIISITHSLEHLHCYGVVHGDLKSENIMIGPHGYVYLIDYGSSFRDNDSKSFTLDMVAPERLLDSFPPDERSDIFSLGLVIQHMLSYYMSSFKGKGNYFQMKKMKRIIKKCKQVNPSLRYQSANEIKDALLLIK
jgi:serine/threonine protein kinase